MNHGIGAKGKPTKIGLAGDTYTATVMLVTDRDHLGRPLVMRVIHDGETVDLAELGSTEESPTEFVIVYANREAWGKP